MIALLLDSRLVNITTKNDIGNNNTVINSNNSHVIAPLTIPADRDIHETTLKEESILNVTKSHRRTRYLLVFYVFFTMVNASIIGFLAYKHFFGENRMGNSCDDSKTMPT